MISTLGMARAGAACGTAALLALTGCSPGSSSSPEAAPFSSGPAHTISTPAQLGSFTRDPSLEKELNVAGLQEQVAQGGSGRTSDVLSAVYVQGSGTPGAGGTQQIFMFVGGHLANSNPAVSIASFERTYPDTRAVSAGSLGGKAACVMTTVSHDSVAMCVWFDNDSFGTLVSPTMSMATLAKTLDAVRPGIERPAPALGT